jgi:predicted RNA-binding Zn-ribbon protein involved in translation (DUF1610 family)
VNRYPTNPFTLNLGTLKFWLICAAIAWFLGAIGLGWLINSIMILLSFVLLLPVVAFIGLRWWLQRNLVQSQCPSCQFEFAHLKQSDLQCPSCGETLKVDGERFVRISSPNTIDVQAVEVPAQVVKD